LDEPLSIRFEREALYEEVWANPMTTLAKKYGMSDNGLRKVCKALSIPLPKVGHWAKVAAGHRIARQPLPPASSRTEVVRMKQQSSPPRPPERSEDDRWLEGRIAFEALPENKISVDMQPSRWHPLTRSTRDALRDKLKELETHQRRGETAQRGRARPVVDFNRYRWSHFNDSGQVFELNRSCLPLRLTPRTWERGLAIMNALLFAAADRGMAPEYDEKRRRLSLLVHDCRVEIRMSERLKQSPREPEPGERSVRGGIVRSPTGILRIYIAGCASETSFEENPHHALENWLNNVMVGVCRGAVRERKALRDREAWHREWEEKQERLRQAETQRQEMERAREREAARRKALLDEARRWQDAATIRAYADHIEQQMRSGESTQAALAEWLDWARRIAAEIDPSPGRCGFPECTP
jgi:hypothetical protein